MLIGPAGSVVLGLATFLLESYLALPYEAGKFFKLHNAAEEEQQLRLVESTWSREIVKGLKPNAPETHTCFPEPDPEGGNSR